MKSIPRAVGEGLSATCLWLVAIVILDADIDVSYYLNGISLGIFIASVVYSIRARIEGNTWQHQFVIEVLGAILLWSGLLLFVLPFSALLSPEGWNAIIQQWSVGLKVNWLSIQAILLLVIYVSGFSIVFLRTLRRFIPYWLYLREKYLIWRLTHSHLTLILLALFFLILSITLNSAASISPIEDRPDTLIQFLIQSASAVILTAVLALLSLAMVLVPAAVVSYSYSSRITESIQDLRQATDALRKGDYRIRVDHNRYDEIGILQENFNAMALELETAISNLENQRDTVTELLQARRELFAGISHELRTPVSTLRSYIDSSISHYAPMIDDHRQQDLQIMQQEIVRLQQLIDDLFTLARTEVNRLELRIQSLDPLPSLKRIIEAVSPTIWQRSRIEVIDQLPSSLSKARIDLVRFEQIIQNLLQYVVHHTPPGGIVVISADANPHYVVIDIKDTGEPIPAQEIPFIWQRFSPAGLGLPLVKELTEAMGGKIDLENLDNQGRCFRIQLPRGTKT